MICPKCHAVIKATDEYCPHCHIPLLQTDRVEKKYQLPTMLIIKRTLIVFFAALLGVICFVFAGVRVYYLYQSKQVLQNMVDYTIETITMDNNIQGHAICFYGNDGDQIYIQELNRGYPFIGSVARVEIPDYFWFEDRTDEEMDMDAISVTFSPVHISQAGEKTYLPAFSLTIDLPGAPLKMITPTVDYLDVITSVTALNMQVLGGSTVIINGEDVSSKVDRGGMLSLNVNIYPTGDNYISILVRTENHHETRKDLVFHRDVMEINLEVDNTTSTSSQLNYMTIKGKTDPGAYLTVESNYEASSLVQDMETGKFSFKAKFSTYGKNLVVMRSTLSGKRDSLLSFYVNYLPARAEYTRNAWKMDYAQLRAYYETWKGRVFLCSGRIVGSYYENDVQYAIMNVAQEGEDAQWVILENQSDIGTMSIGGTYSMYADVAGRIFYKTGYYPHLIARYTKVD